MKPNTNPLANVLALQTQLPALETPLSQRVREIIDAIQTKRQRHLKVGLDCTLLADLRYGGEPNLTKTRKTLGRPFCYSID